MYTYTITQWIAFFIIYCFLGWCWESPYVSIKQKKWVNRGFLHGPFLPIYGSGAVIVLFVSLPLKGSVVAVYFGGMIAATVLEYITGAAMEKIFKVRYWDYSYQKFNLNGHICLTSSIAWGFFSIGMVYWFHKPFEKLVLMVPDQMLVLVVDILVAILAADFAVSLKAAIELRDVIIALEKAKNEARLLQKRVEVMEAFLVDDASQLRDKYEQEMNAKLSEMKKAMQERYGDVQDRYEEIQERYESFLLESKEHSQEFKDKLQVEILELREHMTELKKKMEIKSYAKKDVKALLRRNPSASSSKYRQSFEEFKLEVFPELKSELMEKADSLKEKADSFKVKMDELMKKADDLLNQIEKWTDDLKEDIKDELASHKK